MTPEQSGVWLLERMRKHIGFEGYADKNLLDFGCGVRFSQAIINCDFPIGRYVGVDVYPAMIKFLQENVQDPRFAYCFRTPVTKFAIRVESYSRRMSFCQLPSTTSMSSACSL
jgi:hypothetical protein